jgi:hypothetical protein
MGPVTVPRVAFACVALCVVARPAHSDSAVRTHDGLHVGVSAGVGYYDVSNDDQEFSGGTIAAQLLIGGTAASGFALGGGFIVDHAPSPSTTTDGVSSQTLVAMGLYGDYYLDPRDNGVHVQGFLGWGGLDTSFGGDARGSDPTGLVSHVGIGYEWWVSDQWSFGLLGRVVFAPIRLNGGAFTTLEPAVVGSLTWH